MSDQRRWRLRRLGSIGLGAPALPGIYVLGRAMRFEGLTIKHEFVYAGKTDNLLRRLSQHTRWTERNPGLADWLRSVKGEAWIWYTVVENVDELDELERAVIREILPVYNRLTYRTDRSADHD